MTYKFFLHDGIKKSGKRCSFLTWRVQKLSLSAVLTVAAKISNATEKAKHIVNDITANVAPAVFKQPIGMPHGSRKYGHWLCR